MAHGQWRRDPIEAVVGGYVPELALIRMQLWVGSLAGYFGIARLGFRRNFPDPSGDVCGHQTTWLVVLWGYIPRMRGHGLDNKRFMDQVASGKRAHDPSFETYYSQNCHQSIENCHKQRSTPAAVSCSERFVWVQGPIVVGAGPSGLAAAACLKEKGIDSLVLERSSCIAPLWQLKMYDRLNLHLPRRFCELPFLPFPADYPNYPTKHQFVAYLENYAEMFGICPMYNHTVVCAEYDEQLMLWRVRTQAAGMMEDMEYVSRWLVVATGENAEAVVPMIDGLEEFQGTVMHTSEYKIGSAFTRKRVLVVGCGNSGMEVCLDLCNHNAHPHIVVREAVHILPREVLGQPTFALAMWLLKWLSIHAVDRILLLIARAMLGDTAKLGLKRPTLGPLELKSLSGKTPVLDVGTLAKIKSGDIKVQRAIGQIAGRKVVFMDGRSEEFDIIVLATGYKSNVPCWLKDRELFSEKDGLPRKAFPNGWKGEKGLYSVGFSRRGLMGTAADARRIARDIELLWKAKGKNPADTFVSLSGCSLTTTEAHQRGACES